MSATLLGPQEHWDISYYVSGNVFLGSFINHEMMCHYGKTLLRLKLPTAFLTRDESQNINKVDMLILYFTAQLKISLVPSIWQHVPTERSNDAF